MHSNLALLTSVVFCLLSCKAALTPLDPDGEKDRGAGPGVVRVTEAEFVVDDSPTPPGAAAAWQLVRLPDDWNPHHPPDREQGWYRFAATFTRPTTAALPSTTEGPLAVLLPRVNMSAEVWIDDRKLSGSESRATLPNDFNRPLLFRVAEKIPADEIDWIYIRLRRHAYHQGGLGPIEIGPLDKLSARHRAQSLYRIDLARVATILVVVSALFASALWFATKRDPLYGYFALTAACCAIASLNYWLRELPFDRWTWERMVHGAILGFTVGMGLWSRRLVSIEPSRFDRLLQLYLVTALVAISWIPLEIFYPNVLFLHALPTLIPIYAGSLVYRYSHLLTVAERGIYATGAVVAMGFGLHDLMLQFGWLSSERLHLLTYAMPIVVIIFAGSLVTRFASSLERVNRLNDDLEQRVGEKASELAANYDHMRRLERDRVLLLERERLTREMHDGLGGQLVSALALAEASSSPSPTVAISIRTALADLRTVINSLDPRIADFATLFGLLRTRIEPLFESSEIDIRWRVGDLPAESQLGPEHHLHLLRLLQEAFTNAVRHSGASQIEFTTEWSTDLLTLRVEDDGDGFCDEASSGRGLSNMRDRADALEAQLEIVSTGAGTRVQLQLPLQNMSTGTDSNPTEH